MTVEELICELMATCQSLDDVVLVADSGLCTQVSGDSDEKVIWLNDYSKADSKQA